VTPPITTSAAAGFVGAASNSLLLDPSTLVKGFLVPLPHGIVTYLNTFSPLLTTGSAAAASGDHAKLSPTSGQLGAGGVLGALAMPPAEAAGGGAPAPTPPAPTPPSPGPSSASTASLVPFFTTPRLDLAIFQAPPNPRESVDGSVILVPELWEKVAARGPPAVS
jgi:hypothetical protein